MSKELIKEIKFTLLFIAIVGIFVYQDYSIHNNSNLFYFCFLG